MQPDNQQKIMETPSITKTITIGEIVTNDIRTAKIFTRYGLDFCCGGKQTLEEACLKKGVNITELETSLQECTKHSSPKDENFNEWELDRLADYIVEKHHSYVRSALPLLEGYASKVASVHGSTHKEVVEIYNHFRAVSNELQMHMHKEEFILFPFIKKMAEAKRNYQPLLPPPFGTIRNPIAMMENEHEFAGNSMEAINQLSNGYTPPEDACNTFRVLYAELKNFELDLHQHIHLENNILFPKAIKMEEENI